MSVTKQYEATNLLGETIRDEVSIKIVYFLTMRYSNHNYP